MAMEVLRKFTTPQNASGRGFMDVLTKLYAYYKNGSNVCMEEELSVYLQYRITVTNVTFIRYVSILASLRGCLSSYQKDWLLAKLLFYANYDIKI